MFAVSAMSVPARSQTVPAIKLGSTLTVEDGCIINGGGQNPEALLNFGAVSNAAGITSAIDGSTTVAHDGTSIDVICNVPVGQVLATISGGQNDLDGVRRMANLDVPGEFIPYHMYLDQAHSIEFEINTPVPLFDTGSEQNNRRISSQFFFDIYGRIFAPIDAPAGSYVDTATAELAF